MLLEMKDWVRIKSITLNNAWTVSDLMPFALLGQPALRRPSKIRGDGSLNSAQFMFKWFIRFIDFTEFSDRSTHLGKNPITSWTASDCN